MKVAGGKIANIVGRFLERINADEAALDLMVKIFGFGRYREGAAFRSHKKLEPDGIFKVSDELAHRRLRQVHRLCGLRDRPRDHDRPKLFQLRSEEHTSELQSLMRISYAVFCL